MNDSQALNFSRRVLAWFEDAGRKDLPWQRDINPYRVWVSEIMLQQTQVQTVIPYFERFMAAFPTTADLAGAEQDQVLHLWTGLGYYARARNLHRAARMIVNDLDGRFPGDLEGLCALPGIGRSTAGAIISIAGGQRAAILDGNVKRVLARHGAIAGWPGQTAVLKQLWALAETYTPDQRCGDYSQAMMDLGATLCTRAAPDCQRCPVATDCRARDSGQQTAYPGKKPRKTLPVKQTTLLMIRTPEGETWLEKRPGAGIWGGLFCFPEVNDSADCHTWCLDRWGTEPLSTEPWEPFRHTFSHYHLDIQPVAVTLTARPAAIMEAPDSLWYNMRQPPAVGLAAPVTRLLAKLNSE